MAASMAIDNQQGETVMTFKEMRDWNRSTVAKAHDTRELARKAGGRHGNAGSLTFSIHLELAQQFLQRFCNGMDHAYVRLEVHGDEILILPSGEGERGRKLSRNSAASDYRAFFDGSNYPWIKEIAPFSSTYAKTRLTERGILLTLPPVKDRRPIMPYTQYTPRRPSASVPKPRVALHRPSNPPPVEAKPASTGHMYLVLVPPDVDDKFHMLLRFLKLEALKE
jgi:hypothetical protein